MDASYPPSLHASLLCDEHDVCFEEEQDDDDEPVCLSSARIQDDDDEYIEKLIREDLGFGSRANLRSRFRYDDLTGRCNAIDWILRARAFLGFKLRTAYLSVLYFDRFLARKSLETTDRGSSAVHLLSIACLSLAAKMEETRLPQLSQYPAEDHFETSSIQGAEIVVLIALGWRLASASPFVFLRYFAVKFFKDSDPEEVIPKAARLIMAALKGINLRDGGAPNVAAAAVLAAGNSGFSRKSVELKASCIPSWGLRERDHVFCCYSVMTGIEMAKSNRPKMVFLSSFGNFATSPPVGSKRRHESFDQDDDSRSDELS